jgi:beta-fructofuranosidase
MHLIYNNEDIADANSCPLRPQYHFLPPANWMNDPHGTIFYKNEYHLFYQHNPKESKWGNIHWGHAKSKDLVYWVHLPISLKPDKAKGESHCYTGICVLHNNIPTIIYTSVGPKRTPHQGSEQWLATSTDEMITWKRYGHNPVMDSNVHAPLDIREWRDPYLWKEKKQWYALLAGYIYKPHQAVLLLYKSSDLRNWEYIKIFTQGLANKKITWECPNFFSLNGKHVLIISSFKRQYYTDEVFSIGRKVEYNLGEYIDYQFIPGKWKKVDYGKLFYAPTTIIDPKGRKIIMGWLAAKGKGWNGCLTLPRRMNLGLDNNLYFSPIRELQSLRIHYVRFKSIIVNDESLYLSQEFNSQCFEILMEIEMLSADQFTLKIFKSNDFHYDECIRINIQSKEFWLGKEKIILQDLGTDNILKLHIFIDVSVIEVYINNQEIISGQIIPKDSNSPQIEFLAQNGSIKINKLDLWSIRNIWD